MHRILFTILFIFIWTLVRSQMSHLGLFYSYGAHFNVHKTSDQQTTPSDGSNIGIFYQLENGDKALGFRASFGHRQNDCRFHVTESIHLINQLNAFELKLQCTIPVTSKSQFALGISPRLVTYSSVVIEYSTRKGNTQNEYQKTIMASPDQLNALNTAISLSWYYQFSKRFSCALNLDQDMLPFYQASLSVPIPELDKSVEVNGRLTSLTASLIFNVK